MATSYEMTGAGMLTTQSKTVTAAGTFTHKSPDGVVLETGVWIANELVSFDSYGIAPGALMREGRALGPPQFGPKRMGMFAGSMPAGGLAVLRIRLLPVLGLARSATLQVNCALGKVPDEHPTEGIRLALEGGGVEFDEEISGRALFLLTRSEAAAAAKAPAPEGETNPAPAEGQPELKMWGIKCKPAETGQGGAHSGEKVKVSGTFFPPGTFFLGERCGRMPPWAESGELMWAA